MTDFTDPFEAARPSAPNPSSGSTLITRPDVSKPAPSKDSDFVDPLAPTPRPAASGNDTSFVGDVGRGLAQAGLSTARTLGLAGAGALEAVTLGHAPEALTDPIFHGIDKIKEYQDTIRRPDSVKGRIGEAVGGLVGGIPTLGIGSLSEGQDIIQGGGTTDRALAQTGLNAAANMAGLGLGGLGGASRVARMATQGAANAAFGEGARVAGNALAPEDQQREFDPLETAINFGAGVGFGALPHHPTIARPKGEAAPAETARAAPADIQRPTPETAPEPTVRYPDAAPGSLADAANAVHAAQQAARAPAAAEQTHTPEPVRPGQTTSFVADADGNLREVPRAPETATSGVEQRTPPNVPWIDQVTGEIRPPTDNEVKDEWHRMFEAASQAGKQTAPGASRMLSEEWGVDPTFNRQMRTEAMAERKAGFRPGDVRPGAESTPAPADDAQPEQPAVPRETIEGAPREQPAGTDENGVAGVEARGNSREVAPATAADEGAAGNRAEQVAATPPETPAAETAAAPAAEAARSPEPEPQATAASEPAKPAESDRGTSEPPEAKAPTDERTPPNQPDESAQAEKPAVAEARSQEKNTPVNNDLQQKGVVDQSRDVLESDITPSSGGPFENRGAAEIAAKRAGGDAQVVEVDGGYVVREPRVADAAAPAETEAAAPATTGKVEIGDRVTVTSGTHEGKQGTVARAGKMSTKVEFDDGSSAALSPKVVERTAALEKPQTAVEQAALDSAAHPENNLPEPTPAQHEANNYKQGHINLHGMDVTIQVPKGGMRRGVDRNGEAWERPASDHYGHIRGTDGGDGEPHDVYLGPHAEDSNAKVFVIDQVKPGTKAFDEKKAMIGYASGREARRAYEANFPKGLKTFGGIKEMTLDQFKEMLKAKPKSEPLPPAVKGVRESKATIARRAQEALDAKRAETAGQFDSEPSNANQLSEQHYQKLTNAVREATKDWGTNAPGVRVLRSAEELPQSAKRDAPDRYKLARGYYDGKTAYVVAHNIRDIDRALKTVVHEAVGHHGIEKIVDQHVKGSWDRLVADVQRLREDKTLGSKAMRDTINEVERRYRNPDPTVFAKELLAVMSENGIKNGIIDRAVAAVRAWVRERFPNLKFSEADLHGLLRKSDAFIRTDDVAGDARRAAVRALAFDKKASTFYSALNESLTNARGAPKKGTPDQWKQWLDGAQRRGEFKGSERQWLGIDSWLDEHPTATREDLQKFVRDNQVDVSTVKKPNEASKDDLAMQMHDKPYAELAPDDRAEIDQTLRDSQRDDAPKFEQYVLPGGKNYREHLLILPERDKVTTRAVESPPGWGDTGGGNVGIERIGDRGNDFRGGHYEEPNVLAHVRMNDRTTADGKKALHIEEIQSDWHQRGRRDGYKTEAQAGRNAVPDAPLKNTEDWAMLGFKHALREAVEQGKDRVTWTTGEQQSQRYDLSKHVSEVRYVDGSRLIVYDKDGRVLHNQATPRDKVADVVGKEAADRLLAERPRRRDGSDVQEISGNGLKVGGEGMKGFYDKILPKAVEKYIKQWGGKIDKAELITGNDGRRVDDGAGGLVREGGKPIKEIVHSVDITPAMRESVEKGQPLFSMLEDRKEAPLRVAGVPRAAGETAALWRNDQPLKRDADYRAAKAGDGDAAIRLVDRNAAPLAEQAKERWGSDVTFVAPHAEEATGKNAIPQTLAAYLAAHTGGDVDRGIVQTNRTFHTGADAMQRLLARSEFDGPVEAGKKYVLVDDVTTMGSTLADLAHYIQSKGGEVVGTSTLVNAARDGGKLHADPSVLKQLERRYGDEIRNQFGIDPSALTASEARYLIGFRSADELAGRAAKAAQERVDRLGAKGVRLEEGEQGGVSDVPPNSSESPKGSFSLPDEGERAAEDFGKPQASVDRLNEVLSKPDDTVWQRAKDWARGKAEDFRPAALGALQTRHVIELMEDHAALKGAKHYGDLMQHLATDRNQLMAGAPDAAEHPENMIKRGGATIAEDLRKYSYEKGLPGMMGRRSPRAKQLADVMHDATIYGLDPSEKYSKLTFEDSRGEPVEWSKEGIKERIKELRGQMRGRPGDDKSMMMDEVKRLRNLPKREKLREERWPELVARYGALPEEGKALYKQTRDWYAQMRDETEKGLISRIDSMSGDLGEHYTRTMKDRIRLQFEQMRREGVYFPLNRDGDFWVSFTDSEGRQGFKMFETARDAAQAEKKLRDAGFTIDGQGRRDSDYKAKNAPSGTFVGDVIGILKKANAPEKVQDDIYQLFLKTLPEMSMRKHSIHRQNIPGFSDDALRAFAKNAFHGAHQLARLRYAHQMQGVIDAMQMSMDNFRRGSEFGGTSTSSALDVARGDALLGELKKRNDYIMSPKDTALANKANAIGFIYHLGASPASALVNLTQNAQVTLPVLAAQHGWGKASRMLGAGVRDALRTFGNIDRTLTDPVERQAYNTLRARGDIDKTQTHTLAGLAEGNLLQSSPAWAKTMSAIGYMFHKAEVINRESAGMAAFRLEYGKTKDFNKAVQYASDIINGTHFDYSAANRPRLMQNNAARIALQFKNYSIGMTWAMYRNLYQAFKGETPEVRSVARRTLTGILGMTGLMAGTMGLPIINAMRYAGNAAHALFGDDEPFDFNTEYRNWLADNLGENAAKLIADGPINQLTGATISNRVSLSNMWFQDADRELEGKDAYYNMLESIAGPLGGLVKNFYVGSKMVSDGQVERGVETMMPKFAKDAMKALRYEHEGANTLRGDPIVPDVSTPEALIQALGFTPTRMFDQQRQNSALMNYQQQITDRRKLLMNAYALAVHAGADTDTAMARIHQFNQQYPEIAINSNSIRQSLRARARYSEQAEGGVALNKKLAPRLREDVGIGAAQ